MKKNVTLTKEEKALNTSIAAGEYISVHSKKNVAAYQAAAKNTFAKQKAVNIRISERNLLRLKAAAAREGVSYQTFVTSLIQKHV